MTAVLPTSAAVKIRYKNITNNPNAGRDCRNTKAVFLTDKNYGTTWTDTVTVTTTETLAPTDSDDKTVGVAHYVARTAYKAGD